MIQIKDKVVCQLYADKGIGSVLSREEIFGETICEVLFQKTNEVIRIHEHELRLVEEPLQKLQHQLIGNTNYFLLRWQDRFIEAQKSTLDIHTIGNFKIKPLPHQILVVDFILNQFRPRALIADEVGLGKTIEAALIFEELKARSMVHRVLIIAPSGLCRQWKDELKQKFFEDFVIYDRSTVNSLMSLNGMQTNAWKLNNQIITSIDFVKPKNIDENESVLSPREKKFREFHNQHIVKALEEADFDLVIIDEAHKLSKDTHKKSTARYKIGKSMSDVAPFYLLLSATPHQGKSERFKNLLHLIDPYLFYQGCKLDPAKVKEVTARNNKRAVRDFDGNKLFTHRITSTKRIDRSLTEDDIELKLYYAVSDYIKEYYNYAFQEKNFLMMFLLLLYQRMVSSSSRAILKSFQKRKKKLIDCKNLLMEEEKHLNEQNGISLDEMEDQTSEENLNLFEQADLAGATLNKRDFDVEIEIIDHCIQLAVSAVTGRQDAKMRELILLLDEFKRKENDPNLKFIIFTEFVETQKYIDEVLQQYGYSTALINGSMSLDVKVEQRERFETTAQILVSTDAGGEGVNLQFCNIMIQYDLPWNPMRLEQRIGRVDRIGQQKDVKVVNFQLSDTVEQRVRDKIESKLDLIRQEFNQDENKMADIISTLDEEFDFEKIYTTAIRLREQQTDALDVIANQIYSRAKEIISTDEFLLPYTEWTGTSPITLQDIERKKYQVMNFLTLFLKSQQSELIPYKEQESLYYFSDPLDPDKRKIKAFFDPNLSAKYDTAELISFEHPYVDSIKRYIEKHYQEETTTALQIQNSNFAGKKGLLFLYQLKIENHVNPPQFFLIPCFIEENLEHNNRISKYLRETPVQNAKSLFSIPIALHWSDMEKVAEKTSDELCASQFAQNKNEWRQKIEQEKQKVEKYFDDKNRAIDQIAIENIREGKKKQAQEEKQKVEQEFQKRLLLTPQKDCLGIAYVEFIE